MTSNDQQEPLRAFIRSALLDKGWDVPELASRADVGAPSIYNFLSGSKRAGYRLLNKIAGPLEVAPEKLHRLGGLLPDEEITEEDKIWEDLRAAFNHLDNNTDRLTAVRLVWSLGKPSEGDVGNRNSEGKTQRRRRKENP